jgi:hypothetical protein
MAGSPRTIPPAPEVRDLIDRLVVPLLVERFLRQHAEACSAADAPDSAPQPEARV